MILVLSNFVNENNINIYNIHTPGPFFVGDYPILAQNSVYLKSKYLLFTCKKLMWWHHHLHLRHRWFNFRNLHLDLDSKISCITLHKSFFRWEALQIAICCLEIFLNLRYLNTKSYLILASIYHSKNGKIVQN